MFSNSTIILSFFKNTISVYEVKFKNGKGEIKEKGQTAWKEETLTPIFKSLKKKFGNRFRILLPERKTYLKLLSLTQYELTRPLVLSKMQETVPEVVEGTSFDWKIVAKNRDEYLVQAIAINAKYMKQIIKSIKEANIEIEAIEPVSFALSRLTKDEKEPHVAISNLDEKVICACFKGEVYESLIIEPADKFDEAIKHFINFVNEKWQLKISKVIDTNLNPIESLAIKKDIKGKDAEVLDLAIVGQNLKDNAFDNSKMKKSHVFKIFVLLIFMLFLLIPGYFIFINSREPLFKSKKETSPAPTPETSKEQSPTPTPEAIKIEREEIAILIENGDGTAGSAKEAQDYLQSLGYSDITLGNASSFDHLTITVSVKEGREDVFNLVRNDLAEKYEVDENIYTLDKDDNFDVQIIITTQKKGGEKNN